MLQNQEDSETRQRIENRRRIRSQLKFNWNPEEPNMIGGGTTRSEVSITDIIPGDTTNTFNQVSPPKRQVNKSTEVISMEMGST